MTFTVVIPNFNSKNTIEVCLHSVANQTYLPMEVIIVDDGSTDDSVSIIEQWIKNTNPSFEIHLLQQQNSGPSVARNYGINNAKGDWIAFLDADDCWINTHLQITKKTIEEQENLIMVGFNPTASTGRLPLNKLLFKNYFQTSSTVVRTFVMKSILFNEAQKYSEDYRSWLLIASQYPVYIVRALHAKPVIQRSLAFSGGGLSSNLVKMQEGEISNYTYLYTTKRISWLSYIACSSVSYAKYYVRKWKRRN